MHLFLVIGHHERLTHGQKDLLASDVLIASDGPRLNQERPTIFLGSRGGYSFDMWIDARDGGHHSGGGALRLAADPW